MIIQVYTESNSTQNQILDHPTKPPNTSSTPEITHKSSKFPKIENRSSLLDKEELKTRGLDQEHFLKIKQNLFLYPIIQTSDGSCPAGEAAAPASCSRGELP